MKVLRFTASWCGPCKALAKTLEEVETNIPIDVIDVDERTDLALEYGIRSVPTMVMLDSNNQVVKKMTGTKPQTELREWLNG
jgi:thioredoxin-like negative regulator of GroEL